MLDGTDLHLTQQFAAALVRQLCCATAPAAYPLKRIALCPHPAAGLDHLAAHFGPVVVASARPVLEIDIEAAALDRPLPASAGEAAAETVPWENLKGDASFAASARHVLRAMLGDPPVSIDRLAAAAGLSTRSVQRLLAAEATSFRHLLDEMRRDALLRAIETEGRVPPATLAAAGYSSAAAVNHAVRRWTGLSPTEIARRITEGPTETAAE